MSAHVFLNQNLLPAADAHIPATSEGFLFGHGLFETIKVLNGRPVFLPQHHARLTASARALDLPYATSLAELADRLHRLIAANALVHGSAKVVLFHSDSAPPDATPSAPGELILTRANAYPPDTYTRGFHLRTVLAADRLPAPHALSSHKTLNYLANLLAKRAALAAGFDEPLSATPAGTVIEGATTNVFAVRDGLVLTPSLDCGPLPGIARASVIDLLGPDRIRETTLTTADLAQADELFVTNALLGVMPVSRLDDRALDLTRAPVTQNLLSAYRLHELASLL